MVSWLRPRGPGLDRGRPDARHDSGEPHVPSTPLMRFPLAPMSTDIRVLTGIVLALPLVLAVGGALGRGPGRGILLVITVLVLALYASVWLLWRPTAFEVD